MDTPLDLYGASRAELADLILAQRDQLAELEQRLARQADEAAAQRAVIADLSARLGEALAALTGNEPPPAAPRPTGMPGLKPAGSAPARSPRKRRAGGYGRRRMAPTHRQVHAYAHCPFCQAPLQGGTVRRTREVLEIPRVPVVVTEHVYLERRCACCHRRCLPGPGLAGEVVDQGRLGVGLLALIAWLREELRLPVAAVQRYLATVHGLALSVGAIVSAGTTVAAAAAPRMTETQAAIRASPVVHADETGWREDGRNGYAWTFSTPTHRYFVHGKRAKAVLEAAIGPAYGGVVVSDFYSAYTAYEGRHQYCWAHLLRDADDLVAQHRSDAAVAGWAAALHALYARARAVSDPDPVARRHAQRGLEAEARALVAPWLGQAEAPHRGLCERIAKYLSELFGFVADPSVPPTNNAAERSLRHLVTCRKISGGTRSAAGTATKMALATLFGTWRLQGCDALTECRALLAAPQL